MQEKPSYRFSGELPAALRPLMSRAQWVCWDYRWNKAKEKWDKPPLSAKTGRMEKGGATSPANWGSYAQACATATRKGLAGVGYVLTKDDGITGVDLDDCITDAGTYTEAAAQVLEWGETYAEISPSGAGVRLFCLGKYAGGVVKKDAAGVEVYTELRYLTVTGLQVEGSPSELRPAPRTLEYLARVAGVAGVDEAAAAAPDYPRDAPLPRADGGDYFAEVNRRALANLGAWVPSLHPRAKRHATGAWRVSSKDLGRKLEEDLAYHPHGIRDHGEEQGLTPIDAVMRFGGQASAVDAAMWLCHRLGLEPTALGFRAGGGAGKAGAALNRPREPSKTGAFSNHPGGGERSRESTNGDQAQPAPEPVPDVVDGDDDEPIPPRKWLLGTTFCKEFVSAIIAAGATGKTALRLLQLLALATGKPLTGEHVFRRSRVLWVSLEDNENEMRRRVRAARLHHDIPAAELKGWFFRITLAQYGGKLVVLDPTGNPMPGPLAEVIEGICRQFRIDLVSFDPFVKAHGVDENANNIVDRVMQVLVSLADRLDVAIDTTHHTRKGLAAAGDADGGRGASAMKDALRMGKTLTPMSEDEARTFNIPDRERRRYVRYDDAKVNLAPAGDALWFRLVGVPLGNGTPEYETGDNVQTVVTWTPPDAWKGITTTMISEILSLIDKGLDDGNRYTDGPRTTRGAWQCVQKVAPDKSEPDARAIVRAWVKSGVLRSEEYENPVTRKKVKGLRVDRTKLPTGATADMLEKSED